MDWILKLTAAGAEGPCVDIMEIRKPDDLRDITNLGLTLAEAKQLLARVQCAIATAQARHHAVRRPVCSCRDGVCRIKDYRDHAVATLFGQVAIRLPRFRCAGCGRIETGINWPSHCRSTPELDRLRAHLSALMSYPVAAELLEQMFPVDAGTDPETLRRHTLKVGAAFADRATIERTAAVPAITVAVDSSFVRSRENEERRFEVRVGNVETKTGGRQVFGGVAKAATDIEELIRKNLKAVGGTKDTVLTAFTDGCPGLRGILAGAGVLEPPILDWFHIAMKLQHLKQITDGLVAVDPMRTAAKAVIATEVERLHWRIWNGKAKDARKSIERIRPVMHHFRGERDNRRSIAPSRKGLDGLAGAEQVFDRPERVAGELRRTPSRRVESWYRDHRRDSQFPDEPPDEQKSANAMVAARRRPAASGSVRGL